MVGKKTIINIALQCYQVQIRFLEPISSIHSFKNEEKKEFRQKLVTWFQENQRDLPWRNHLSNPDVDQRAYAGKFKFVHIDLFDILF